MTNFCFFDNPSALLVGCRIQKNMMPSPRNFSFDFGRPVGEDKSQVPVAKIMSQMLRSQIQSDKFKDSLRLEVRLNARIREFNYSGAKGELLFVYADEHPDGWKLRARYRKQGGRVSAGGGVVLEGDGDGDGEGNCQTKVA
jgi:hypothetical protein